MQGDPILSIDNCEKPLQGQLFCQMLTEPIVKVRVLGLSKNCDVPTCCTMFATGNNLTVIGDLAARVLVCRLDAEIENPGERIFNNKPDEDARRLRQDLVWSGLTLIMAYRAAGMPDQRLNPFGGFEQWSRWIREPLVWHGFDDPYETAEEIRDADPVKQSQVTMFNALAKNFGNQPWTAAEVLKLAEGHERVGLAEALAEVATKGKVTTRGLGIWLRQNKDCIVGSYRLERYQQGKGRANSWRIKNLENEKL